MQSGGREIRLGPQHRYSVYSYSILLNESTPVKEYIKQSMVDSTS